MTKLDSPAKVLEQTEDGDVISLSTTNQRHLETQVSTKDDEWQIVGKPNTTLTIEDNKAYYKHDRDSSAPIKALVNSLENHTQNIYGVLE